MLGEVVILGFSFCGSCSFVFVGRGFAFSRVVWDGFSFCNFFMFLFIGFLEKLFVWECSGRSDCCSVWFCSFWSGVYGAGRRLV